MSIFPWDDAQLMTSPPLPKQHELLNEVARLMQQQLRGVLNLNVQHETMMYLKLPQRL
ncbi:hypothetical protein HMPREF0297_1699 [Corynebacterium jeikeium ATCC 43734]|nr:hypothetical protein HMPREF0297_1699 [Corynebacterium jeikeium ATCC 43734]